jgi:N-acyl-D-aspartate/D-glutamate deacylase
MPGQPLEDFVPQMRKSDFVQGGMNADISVFDPAMVAEKATYQGSNQPAIGVQSVLVNGGFAMKDSKCC